MPRQRISAHSRTDTRDLNVTHTPQRTLVQRPDVGDLVVTKVSHRFHVGRAEVDGEAPHAAIAVKDRLVDAIALACRFVTGDQRVFLCAHPGSPDYVEFDRANPH